MCEISLPLFVPSIPIPQLWSCSGVQSLVISSVRRSVTAKEGTDCYSLATVMDTDLLWVCDR